ncbi:hypothetical protein ABPG74_018051 [Tetrahymena malaccensis]
MNRQQLPKEIYFKVDYKIQEPNAKENDQYIAYQDKLLKFYLSQRNNYEKYQALSKIEQFNKQSQEQNVCFWFESKDYEKKTDYQHIFKHIGFPVKSKEIKIQKGEDHIRYQQKVKLITNERARIVKFNIKGAKDQLILIHFLPSQRQDRYNSTWINMKKYLYRKFISLKRQFLQRLKKIQIPQQNRFSEYTFEMNPNIKTKRIEKIKKSKNSSNKNSTQEYKNIILSLTCQNNPQKPEEKASRPLSCLIQQQSAS